MVARQRNVGKKCDVYESTVRNIYWKCVYIKNHVKVAPPEAGSDHYTVSGCKMVVYLYILILGDSAIHTSNDNLKYC